MLGLDTNVLARYYVREGGSADVQEKSARTLVERLITVVLKDLSEAFGPVADVDFLFERLEVNPRFAAISRLSNACVLTRLRIEMEDRGGKLEHFVFIGTIGHLEHQGVQPRQHACGQALLSDFDCTGRQFGNRLLS